MTDLKDLTDEQIAAELGKLGKEAADAQAAFNQGAEARYAIKKRLVAERDRRIIAQVGTLSMKELNQLLKSGQFEYFSEVHDAIKTELEARKEAYRKQKQIQDNPPSKYDEQSDDQLAGLTPEGVPDEDIIKVIRALRTRMAQLRTTYHNLQEAEKRFDSAMTGQPPDLRTIRPLEPRRISGKRR
jgi:hypothetical protein